MAAIADDAQQQDFLYMRMDAVPLQTQQTSLDSRNSSVVADRDEETPRGLLVRGFCAVVAVCAATIVLGAREVGGNSQPVFVYLVRIPVLTIALTWCLHDGVFRRMNDKLGAPSRDAFRLTLLFGSTVWSTMCLCNISVTLRTLPIVTFVVAAASGLILTTLVSHFILPPKVWHNFWPLLAIFAVLIVLVHVQVVLAIITESQSMIVQLVFCVLYPLAPLISKGLSNMILKRAFETRREETIWLEVLSLHFAAFPYRILQAAAIYHAVLYVPAIMMTVETVYKHVSYVVVPWRNRKTPEMLSFLAAKFAVHSMVDAGYACALLVLSPLLYACNNRTHGPSQLASSFGFTELNVVPYILWFAALSCHEVILFFEVPWVTNKILRGLSFAPWYCLRENMRIQSHNSHFACIAVAVISISVMLAGLQTFEPN